MDGVLAPKTDGPTSSDVLESLSREELATWRLKDELPDRVRTPAAVEEPPAAVEGDEPALTEPPGETEAPEDTAPEPEASDAGRASRRNRLDERRTKLRNENALYEDTIQRLGGWAEPAPAKEFATPQAEIDALARRRHELIEHTNRLLRQGAGVRAPQVAQAPQAAPRVTPTPAESFPTFDAWLQQHPEKDWSQYVGEATAFEVDRRLTAAREADRRASIAQKAQQQIDAFKAEHPDFDTVLSHATGTPALIEALAESDFGPQIAYYLGQHPEESRRLAGLAPVSFLKAFGRLEARFESAPAAAVVPSSTASVTTAPPPPPTLGTRPGQPADPSRAALDRGDFRAFKAAEDVKALSRAKASGRL